MNIQQLIGKLPPYQGNKVLIVQNQDVPDIMKEIVDAHKIYTSHYDLICEYFWTGNIYTTCKGLWNFCKQNIRYEVEGLDNQTTKSPAAILHHLKGDCKHYAGFIGGILDAINRCYDEEIKWRYRFASYDLLNSTPGHVFVVAWDTAGEIWIDPVLSSFDERLEPAHTPTDKKATMSLQRVSGINDSLFGYSYPGIGAIDPATVMAVINTVANFVKGFGDKVPNYPIKSQNTYNAMVQDVKKIYGGISPTSIAQAQQMLQKTEAELQREINYDTNPNGPLSQSYQMMLSEVIEQLKAYIQTDGQIKINWPNPPSANLTGAYKDFAAGSGILPGNTGGGNNNNSGSGSGISNTTLLLLGAGALLLFSSRRGRVNGRKDNTMMYVLLGGAALLLLSKKAPAQPGSELPEMETDPGTKTPGILPAAAVPGESFVPAVSTDIFPATTNTGSGGGGGSYTPQYAVVQSDDMGSRELMSYNEQINDLSWQTL